MFKDFTDIVTCFVLSTDAFSILNALLLIMNDGFSNSDSNLVTFSRNLNSLGPFREIAKYASRRLVREACNDVCILIRQSRI